MSIFNINTDYTGQVGITPRTVKIACDDSYATITAAGYLSGSQNQGYNFFPRDVFEISYLNNAFGIFLPTFSGNSITLVASVQQGDVTLPVVSGNLAKFSGTTGTIADSGIAAVNVPTYASLPVTNGAFPKFNGTAGVLGDSGIQVTNLQMVSTIKGAQLTWTGGSASHAFTITGLMTTSVINLTQASAANAETILSFTVGTNTVTITWTGDPGAVVVHAIALVAPQ